MIWSRKLWVAFQTDGKDDFVTELLSRIVKLDGAKSTTVIYSSKLMIMDGIRTYRVKNRFRDSKWRLYRTAGRLYYFLRLRSLLYPSYLLLNFIFRCYTLNRPMRDVSKSWLVVYNGQDSLADVIGVRAALTGATQVVFGVLRRESPVEKRAFWFTFPFCFPLKVCESPSLTVGA